VVIAGTSVFISAVSRRRHWWCGCGGTGGSAHSGRCWRSGG
jgi:hypothetical protein